MLLADPLNDNGRAILRKLLADIPAIVALAPETRDSLLIAIEHQAPHYEIHAAVQKTMKRSVASRGNKPAVHIAQLLADCARIWGEATNTEPTIWATSTSEAPAVTIARAVMALRKNTRDRWSGDLRRQINAAQELLI